MDCLILIHTKCEQNVVGVERMAVRKLEATPKFDSVFQPVLRNFAAFRECWFRELRDPIDVDEIRLHQANDFARRSIRRNDWV